MRGAATVAALRQWLGALDPWLPRPSDYVVAAVGFLLLGLLFVGERNYAVDLNRRVFELREHVAALRNETDLLASRATALADRERIVAAATEIGLVFPRAEQLSWIYYVPGETQAPARR